MEPIDFAKIEIGELEVRLLELKEEIASLQTKNKRLKKAILDFGNNPAGFDWGVLEKMDSLEAANAKLREALESWMEATRTFNIGDMFPDERKETKQALKATDA